MSAQVRSNSATHPPGRVLIPTQPGWDYLVFATSGLITAVTDTEAWTIPAQRALCVPDGTRVRIASARSASVHSLYFATDLGVLGNEVRVVRLASLTRELVFHAVALAPMTLETAPRRALVTLLKEQLEDAPEAALDLALPADPVARGLAEAIMDDPAVGLDQRLGGAAASRRTIERRFAAETFLSLGQWHRRARLLAAVGMLAGGQSVTDVALTVGYASSSAFGAAFKAELGASPREFVGD